MRSFRPVNFQSLALILTQQLLAQVEEHDGIDAIESVQFSSDEVLSGLSSFLVNKFYGEDYGLEDDEVRVFHLSRAILVLLGPF